MSIFYATIACLNRFEKTRQLFGWLIELLIFIQAFSCGLVKKSTDRFPIAFFITASILSDMDSSLLCWLKTKKQSLLKLALLHAILPKVVVPVGVPVACPTFVVSLELDILPCRDLKEFSVSF